jgi:hypothetical protein
VLLTANLLVKGTRKGVADELDVGGLAWRVRACLTAGRKLGRELVNELDATWPFATASLRQRVLVPPGLALEAYGAVRADIGDPKLRRLKWILTNCVGMGGSWLSNVLMACASSRRLADVIWRVVSRGVASNGLECWIKVLKEYHAVWRQTNDSWTPMFGLEHGEGHELMYLYTLAGRYDHASLRKTEDLEVRAEHGRAQATDDDTGRRTTEQFDRDASTAMRHLVERFAIAQAAAKPLTAQQFHAQLHRIGTSGSTSYTPVGGLHFTNRKGEVVSARATKNSALVEMETEYIDSILLDRPHCHGVGIKKLENAALRLLLPGPFRHWLIESIALYHGEQGVYRALPEMSMSEGPVQTLLAVTNRLAALKDGATTACSDYADFNRLHTFERMRELWLRLAEAVCPMGKTQFSRWSAMPDEQFAAACCSWVAAALTDVAARDSADPDKWYELVRGLWSGWRSTTFINTSFNYCYAQALEAQHMRRHGRRSLVWMNILGDDMVSRANSEWDALTLLASIDEAGLDAQPIKQMLGSDYCEYLRIIYYADGVVAGSLCRGISGLTSGDLQTSARSGGPETAHALNMGLHRLIRRGADVDLVERFRYSIVRHWATVHWYTGTGGKRSACPSQALLTGSLASGGLGCGRYGEVCKPVLLEVTRPRPRRLAVKHLKPLAGHGSKAAVAEGNARLGRYLSRAVHWQEHAMPLVLASLPNDVLGRWRNQGARDLGEWYQNAGAVQQTHKVLPKVARVVGHAVDAVVASIVGRYPLPAQARIDEVAAHVVHSALGTLSPVPGMVSRLGTSARNRVRVLLRASDVSAGSARSTVMKFGVSMADKLMTGKIGLALDTGGVIAPEHRAIADYAIALVLDEYRLELTHSTNLVSFVELLKANAAQELVKLCLRNDMISKQLHY